MWAWVRSILGWIKLTETRSFEEGQRANAMRKSRLIFLQDTGSLANANPTQTYCGQREGGRVLRKIGKRFRERKLGWMSWEEERVG